MNRQQLHDALKSAGLLTQQTLWDDVPHEVTDRRNGSGHKLIAACGLGLNSVAGLILMAARGDIPDAILFADTVAEKNRTYAYLSILNDWLLSVGLPSLTTVKRDVKHDKQKNEEKYDNLEQECLVKQCLPSIAYFGRSCSIKWKHEPQEKWARNREEYQAEWNAGRRVVKAIFYDAGEAYRANHARNERYQYWHPLFSVGWDRAGCVKALEIARLPIPPKSSCFFCPEMTPAEIFDLQDNEPDLLARALVLEANAKLTSIKGLGKHNYSWKDLVAGRVPLTTIEAANKSARANCMCSEDSGAV